MGFIPYSEYFPFGNILIVLIKFYSVNLAAIEPHTVTSKKWICDVWDFGCKVICL